MLGLDLAQLVENGNASVVSLIPMGCHDGGKGTKMYPLNTVRVSGRKWFKIIL